jgi:sugar/nucleoside kinase (ribokinase family)
VRVLDTTGAGDVFNACLLCEILNKNDLIFACKYANKMAALSVEKAYVLDAIPRREENE